MRCVRWLWWCGRPSSFRTAAVYLHPTGRFSLGNRSKIVKNSTWKKKKITSWKERTPTFEQYYYRTRYARGKKTQQKNKKYKSEMKTGARRVFDEYRRARRSVAVPIYRGGRSIWDLARPSSGRKYAHNATTNSSCWYNAWRRRPSPPPRVRVTHANNNNNNNSRARDGEYSCRVIL